MSKIICGDSAVAAVQHTRERLNIADGGYHGWTDDELIRLYCALTTETDVKISQKVLDMTKVTN
jgi:hypothetical protein